jgi:hypothetical protein
MLIMRKLVFAALAVVFMLSSGFVSSEIDNTESIISNCEIVITRTTIDDNGDKITETRTHYYNAADERDCNYVSGKTLRMYQLGFLKF